MAIAFSLSQDARVRGPGLSRYGHSEVHIRPLSVHADRTLSIDSISAPVGILGKVSVPIGKACVMFGGNRECRSLHDNTERVLAQIVERRGNMHVLSITGSSPGCSNLVDRWLHRQRLCQGRSSERCRLR